HLSMTPSAAVCFATDAPTTEFSPLSLHDALPISSADSMSTVLAPSTAYPWSGSTRRRCPRPTRYPTSGARVPPRNRRSSAAKARSEEHTSELQSRENLVCRLLLEKKKQYIYIVGL